MTSFNIDMIEISSELVLVNSEKISGPGSLGLWERFHSHSLNKYYGCKYENVRTDTRRNGHMIDNRQRLWWWDPQAKECLELPEKYHGLANILILDF